MIKTVRLWILLVVLAGVGGVAAFRTMYTPKPGFVNDAAERRLPSMANGESSAYSIQWGARMAKVVDQAGNGVPGAAVTFNKYLNRDCDGHITEDPPAWQGTTVTANKKGEFIYPPEIWQLEEGQDKPSIHVDIEAQGFLPRKGVGVGVNYAHENGEIDIFRIGRIEGAMIDPNGRPLANIPIRLSTCVYYKLPSAFSRGSFDENVKTDETGGFVFEKVPPGLHVVKFPGYAGGCGPEPAAEKVPFAEYATFQGVDMKDGQIRSDVFLDLRQDRATVKGRVVDEDNRPMAGVNAMLSRENKQYDKDGHGWTSMTENLKSATTDENGNYTLTLIPAGDYQLKANYPSEKGKSYRAGDPLNIYLAGKQEVTFSLVLERQDDSVPKPDPREESLFEVPLPEGLAENEMMIVDPRGNGIGGASVVFDKTLTLEDQKTRQKTTQEWNGASLMTDERGIVTLPAELTPVEGKRVQCSLKVEAEGFENRQIGWFSPSQLKEDRRIDILPLSEIKGQLIGTDGKPVNGRVELRDRVAAFRNPSSAESGGGSDSKVTDAAGRFDFDKISEGVHVIHYTVDEKRTGGVIVYTQGGQDVDDLVIDLRKDTCTVRGRVLDPDGKPVKKARVRLCKSIRWGYNGSCTTRPEFYRSDPTNPKGEYAIENIGPGVYEIQAAAEGDPRRTSDPMTIAVADGQAIELDIRLNR